jgi:hypothetical protein
MERAAGAELIPPVWRLTSASWLAHAAVGKPASGQSEARKLPLQHLARRDRG